ncbi:hypothetical protein GRJ2_001084400 [Grus japonensis]|uniref:Uncharacterized protein n=1 Tax=Grus japonensis TaxID=30415 RepID=A0ABC9WL41_GRUJA
MQESRLRHILPVQYKAHPTDLSSLGWNLGPAAGFAQDIYCKKATRQRHNKGVIWGTSQSGYEKALAMHLASTVDNPLHERQEEEDMYMDTVVFIKDLTGQESLQLSGGLGRGSRMLVAGVGPHTLLTKFCDSPEPSWMARQEQN